MWSTIGQPGYSLAHSRPKLCVRTFRPIGQWRCSCDCHSCARRSPAKSLAAMEIAVPPNSVIYAIVLVHAMVSGYHGWSHHHSAVPTTLAQNIFIVAVVFASPILAVILLVRGRIHPGIALFSLSMLGALIFGLLFHFALDTADLYSNVRGIGAQTFFVSALLLAAVEFIGFVWGGYCWWRLITCRSKGAPQKRDVP